MEDAFGELQYFSFSVIHQSTSAAVKKFFILSLSGENLLKSKRTACQHLNWSLPK
jgi:hypothetical protein